jgi:hypothetical protein
MGEVKIDIGPVHYLDPQTIEEAPCPDIYLGRRLRRAEPPTTRRLAETLANWTPTQREQ